MPIQMTPILVGHFHSVCSYKGLYVYHVATAHTLEHLVKLESQRGPLSEFSPAIDDVLEYLTQVLYYILAYFVSS